MSSAALAEAQFREHFHACAFVAGPAEEKAVIEPFLIEGLRQRQKAVTSSTPCIATSTGAA